MKKWFILIGVLSGLVIGGYLFLSHYAVKFIDPHVRKVTGPGLTLGEIKIEPRYLSLKNVRYADSQTGRDLMRIEEVRVYPAPLSFLRGRPRIGELSILGPVFHVFRSRQGIFTGPMPPLAKMKKGEGLSEERRTEAQESAPIVIDKIHVERGTIDFQDDAYGNPPVKIELSGLNFSIEDVRFPPSSLPSPFELKGKTKGKSKEGEIEAKGWIVLQTLDMETFLKVGGIEIRTFEPYYQERVSAEIESGEVHLEAKLSIERGKIDAPGYVELSDLRIKEGGTVFWVPAQTVASLLEKKDHRIKARFRIQGNMDDPRFNLQETLLTRIGIALAEALGIPIRTVGETVFGSAGKGAQGLEEGLKALGEIFNRDKKK